MATILDHRVHLWTTLGWEDNAYAVSVMRELVQRADPILAERGWRVLELKEFYPRDKRLLGLNVNRGQEVCVRFRHPENKKVFLPKEAIIGTMLHELCHCKVSPHNAAFWALHKELVHREESKDVLLAQARSVARGDTTAMITGVEANGRKLGGKVPVGLSPRDAVALAAAARQSESERRITEGCNEHLRRIRPREDEKETVSNEAGSPRNSQGQSSWPCPRCGFINHALLFPVCEICSEDPCGQEIPVSATTAPNTAGVSPCQPDREGSGSVCVVDGTGSKENPLILD